MEKATIILGENLQFFLCFWRARRYEPPSSMPILRTLEGPPWIHFKNRMRMHLCVPVNLDTTRCIACTHVVTQSEAGQFDQFRTGLCENCWDGAFLCCLAEDAVFRLVQPSTGDESGLWIQSPVIIILDGKPLGLGFPCSEREFVTPYHMGAGPSRQIEPGETPTILVHGTYKQYIPSIQKRGLRCRRRDLHLQDPSEHAFRWRRDLEVKVVVDVKKAEVPPVAIPPPYWGSLIWLTSQHIPVEAILRYEGWDDLRGDSQRQSSFF